MNLNDLTIQRNMILMIFMICLLPVLASICDEFWHRFGNNFGIPLASNSMFWGDRFGDAFWCDLLIDFDRASKKHHGNPLKSLLFRLCSAVGVFESYLAHVGSLLAPFWLHVGHFGYPL